MSAFEAPQKLRRGAVAERIIDQLLKMIPRRQKKIAGRKYLEPFRVDRL